MDTPRHVEEHTTRRALRARPPRKRWDWGRAIVVVAAVLGTATIAYPAAASWTSSLQHNGAIDGYVRGVDSQPDALLQAELDRAHAYNAALPDGPIRDPYVLSAAGEQTAIGEGEDAYFKTLSVVGSDAMARIRIPAIGVDLPVYHGTDEATLARGIGHLFGSALPVGGVGTHAVLTGHNGFAQATLFDHIGELRDGDLIIIDVLGQSLYYQVDQQTTVLPSETDSLRKVPGRDYLTLVTCTPTGVNTHRLLVRAERIDAPRESAQQYSVDDTTSPPEFPWWAVEMIVVPAGVMVIVRPRKRRSPRARP